MIQMVPRPDPNIRPVAPMLEVVGRIPVPDVSGHRFVVEAHAIAQLRDEQGTLERVIGTVNTKEPELYGWGSNVDSHVDNTGFMYLVPLVAEESFVYAMLGDDVVEQKLVVGEVVRLWDYALHWTTDSAPVVAVFLGSFDTPCDAEAIAKLTAAVQALVAGEYYTAPRVRDGFRVVMDDECIATKDWEHTEIVLQADLKKRRMHLLQCGQCEKPAFRVDQHFPYFQEMNRCREHWLARDRSKT